MNLKWNISGVILSGGQSLRMGENKAFIAIDGIPIIKRIHNVFKKLFQEILIITNEKELFSLFDARIYSDLIPNRGALAGLYTGLFFSSFSHSFCVACDMPFLKESVIEFLIHNMNDFDVIVPKTTDGLQPLHAIYSKNCLPAIKKVIDQGGKKIIDFYPLLNIKMVEGQEFYHLDPKMESFININTPEELRLLKQGNPLE
jgi:molybdopterin-guanine dinucleotide biosynthesis protein A